MSGIPDTVPGVGTAMATPFGSGTANMPFFQACLAAGTALFTGMTITATGGTGREMNRFMAATTNMDLPDQL